MKNYPSDFWSKSDYPPFSSFENFLSFQLLKVAYRLHFHIQDILSEEGLVPAQYSILLGLYDGGGSNQITLCEKLGIDKASMVQFIDGLESLGFAERKIGQDRRERIVLITKSGQNIIKKLKPIIKECEDDFLHNLKAEERKSFRSTVTDLL